MSCLAWARPRRDQPLLFGALLLGKAPVEFRLGPMHQFLEGHLFVVPLRDQALIADFHVQPFHWIHRFHGELLSR